MPMPLTLEEADRMYRQAFWLVLAPALVVGFVVHPVETGRWFWQAWRDA